MTEVPLGKRRRRHKHGSTGLVAKLGVLLAGRVLWWCNSPSWTIGTAVQRRTCKQAAVVQRAVEAAAAETASASTDDTDKLNSTVGGTFWINRPQQRSFEVRWEEGDTLGDLKSVIRQATDIPPKKQELRINGAEIYPDELVLEDLALEVSGVTAIAGGKGPDIWLFDGRSDEEREAVDPPAGYYSELDDPDSQPFLDTFRVVFYGFFILPVTLYVVTQALGVNPFEGKDSIILEEKQPLQGQFEPPDASQNEVPKSVAAAAAGVPAA